VSAAEEELHKLAPEQTPDEPSAVESRALAEESAERRRISEDLHDGTQQRLVVLLLGISELIGLIDSDPDQAVRLARRLETQAQEAIRELRALVHGFQPPVLTALGLVHALHDISRSLPVKVSMITQGVHRYEDSVEDAVFFTCREALQNAVKHAPSATVIWLTLIDSVERLDFSVEDNGQGFDAALPGSGTATMQRRVRAVGGTLTVTSAPGAGTRVEGSIPTRGWSD
jgi:signal transduction histidine kinase